MATLQGGSLLDIGGQGPAPLKDYFNLHITDTQVIWRWWKISLRTESRNTKPGELRESHSDYLEDSRLQSQVALVFGPRILQYSRDLCRGQGDYIQRLPDSLILTIMAHLGLEDIAQLAGTCSRFKKLCSSEEFWEQTVRMHCGTVSAGMEELAEELGWRTVFFTNKLQLQKQISRRKLKNEMVSAGLQVDSMIKLGDWTTETKHGLN
ncbi:F-box only protein 36b [Salminus brasiliensis]|uniref:F-box only protein 36b n=1 Tax=Salminus brasiliensis TaxID=930266 RepID=UPI003B83979A